MDGRELKALGVLDTVRVPRLSPEWHRILNVLVEQVSFPIMPSGMGAAPHLHEMTQEQVTMMTESSVPDNGPTFSCW
jgi:hypothetical protein